jgi:hypothetical protein
MVDRDPQDYIEELREILPPGTKVYTVLRHVADSKMTRWISPIVIDIDDRSGKPKIRDISYLLKWAFPSHFQTDKRWEGLKRVGVGMDMGFDLVYTLARLLYREGFECIGEGCPSNDHSNGDRDYTPGHCVHSDGGYALTQEWL